MTLMSDNGDIREDLRVPDSDVGKEIEAKFEAGDDFMVSVQMFVLRRSKASLLQMCLQVFYFIHLIGCVLCPL